MSYAVPPKFPSSIYNNANFVEQKEYVFNNKRVYQSSGGNLTISQLEDLVDVYYFGAVGTDPGINVPSFTLTLPTPTRDGIFVVMAVGSTAANTYTLTCIGSSAGNPLIRASGGSLAAASSSTSNNVRRSMLSAGGCWVLTPHLL